jgi:TolB-like protein/AraC-like DNA-binding protein/Tfp pilus assembly protein PilF
VEQAKALNLHKTIAVLPFLNMGGEVEDEYFSDGITEEIINALARIKALKVTSRTSSFFFKKKNIPIQEIGKTLGVSAILEGSVRRAGATVRITAQLIQAEEDFHFWSETWDRKLENIFEVQDEISLLIAEKLREQFGHFEIQEHLVEPSTHSMQAYELTLKGKFYFNKWNPEDIRIAIPYFEEALKIDPNYPDPYIGLADSYGFLATTGYMPYVEAWQKSAEMTQKALEINSELPGAYYQMANFAFFTSGNYSKAMQDARKAIALKPTHVEAQQFVSYMYVLAGNQEASRMHLDIALSVDPLSQETLFFNGYFDYMVGAYDQSLDKLNQCLDHNSKNLPAHTIKCYCLLKLGRYEEVLHYFDDFPPEIIVAGDRTGLSTLAYILKNDKENSRIYLDKLTEEASQPGGFRADSYLYLCYGAAGDADRAFAWMERAEKQNPAFQLIHLPDPLVEPIKTDPRYKALCERLFVETQDPAPTKNKKNLLEADTVSEYTQRMLEHMQEAKPYLDPGLSLRTLASQLDIHPNQLSWLLNESLGKNFHEFVNQYRVEAFKEIAKDPKNDHLTLIGMAYDSGFNSKTVFNTYFKKETGLTPKQFLKGQRSDS